MRGITKAIIAVVVVLIVGGGAFYWFVLRDDAPDKLTLKSDTSSSDASTTDPSTLTGTWKVVAGSGAEETAAGYRVEEKFAAGVAKVTAAGRTPDVTGSVTVASGKVTAAQFEVNMTTLTSDKPQRDNQIRNRGVETSKFPKATYALTAPVQLPTITEGKVFTVDATGNLTLHGVTKKVTVPLKVKKTETTFSVQGSVPIVMADYKIDPPNISGFVTVDGNGSLEFLASLAKA